jgi:hypothetical protein
MTLNFFLSFSKELKRNTPRPFAHGWTTWTTYPESTTHSARKEHGKRKSEDQKAITVVGDSKLAIV